MNVFKVDHKQPRTKSIAIMQLKTAGLHKYVWPFSEHQALTSL